MAPNDLPTAPMNRDTVAAAQSADGERRATTGEVQIANGEWHRSIDERTFVRLTWLLAALGLALRLALVHITNESRPNSPARLGGDELSYDGLARDVLAGIETERIASASIVRLAAG